MIFTTLLKHGFAKASAWAAPIARPTIVFIGDSITEYWSGADPWLFRPVRFNAGISGQTAAQMRARFTADVVARCPRAVHIMGGTNDLWFGDPGEGAVNTLDHIAAMAGMARAAGIAVILAPPPPIARRAAHQFGHLPLFEVLRSGIAECARTNGMASSIMPMRCWRTASSLRLSPPMAST